jgi:uncharacterized coiled-coil protein SlyX
MAAPDSPPGLSVVSDGPSSARATPKRPEPIARKAEPKRAERKGAPWWLVVVVAAVGLILFVTQFQRAERLDARVASLSEELAATDQRLEIANLHLTAHQSHLEKVRASVSALSDQVVGLQALTDRDPLAPVVHDASGAAASAAGTDSATGSDAEAAAAPTGSESDTITEADGYYWRADSAAVQPAMSDADRRAIVDGAIGTSFSDD